jgi:uncharacterized Fe-S cluster-containing radical SAM superfamily protein
VALAFPFDPVERSREVESLVMSGTKRRYHKFRAAPYYGGIATADAVGCSFLCAYCWNYSRNENPSAHGRLYSPEEVARNLLGLARRRSYHLFRITGSEPILGEASLEHVLAVVGYVFQEMPQSKFILETNGLMLGFRTELAARLGLRNLMIRISLKGTDLESFEKISGARRDFFSLPLRALKELESRDLEVWPALMEDFFTERDIAALREILRASGIRAELELERLEPYPAVLAHLDLRGITLDDGRLLDKRRR